MSGEVAEKVSEEITRALDTLHGLCAEIGESAEAQAALDQELVATFTELVRDIEEKKREKLERLKIALVRDSEAIAFIAREIGVEPPVPAKKNSILEQHLENVAVLTGLAQKRSSKLDRLRSLHRDLRVLKKLLGDETDVAPLKAQDIVIGEQGEYAFLADPPAVLTSKRLLDFEIQIEKAKTEASERQDILTPLSESIVELLGLMQEEKINGVRVDVFDEEDDFDGALSTKRIEVLRAQLAQAEQERERREAQIKELSGPIQKLWDLLGVPKQEREEFIDAQSKRGLSHEVVDQCRSELMRLEGLIEERVSAQREKIEHVLRSINEIEAAEEDVNEWKGLLGEFEEDFESTEYSMALCDRHAAALQVYESMLTALQKIVVFVKQREELCQKKLEFESRKQDPTRLQGRDRAAAKALLEEGKTRKLLQRLPGIEKAILNALKRFKQEFGRSFMYHGEVYGKKILEERAQITASTSSAAKPVSATPAAKRAPKAAGRTGGKEAPKSACPLRTRNARENSALKGGAKRQPAPLRQKIEFGK